MKRLPLNRCGCVFFHFRLTSVSGRPLTNPRTISRLLIQDSDRPHATLNLLFMQFGQLLTHDVTMSASITTRMSFTNHIYIADNKKKSSFHHILSYLMVDYLFQVMVRQFDAAARTANVFYRVKRYTLPVCQSHSSLMMISTVNLIRAA